MRKIGENRESWGKIGKSEGRPVRGYGQKWFKSSIGVQSAMGFWRMERSDEVMILQKINTNNFRKIKIVNARSVDAKNVDD